MHYVGYAELASAAFGQAANEASQHLTGRVLPEPIVAEALARLEPVADPMTAQLAEMARRDQDLGYAPAGDVSGMVDGSLLQELARR